jgi:F-box/leucine-rich repeat protein 2/20
MLILIFSLLFHLLFSHRITDAAFDFSACPFDPFMSCLKLESISLQGCPQITGEIVDTLNKNFRRLNHLNLQQCKNVRLPCLQQVFCHNALRTLNLAFIDGVSDELFSLLPATSAEFLTSTVSTGLVLSEQVHSSLRALNLCRSKITDFSIYKIVLLQDLEEIHLPWCTGITDAGVVALAVNCTKLKVIDLKSCPITDVALRAIGRRCLQLLELDLSWCFGVSDDGLQELLPQDEVKATLMCLSLVWCPQITDRSLGILSQISSLQRVQLKGCPEVTSRGVGALTGAGVMVEM